MKKRILGILIAALALSMVFAMISCGGGDKKTAQVTLTFEPSSTQEDAFAPYTTKVNKDKPIAASVFDPPTALDTTKYEFIEWLDDTGAAVDPDSADGYSSTDNTFTARLQDVVPPGTPITITYHANGWTGAGVPTALGAGTSGELLPAAELPTLTDTATQLFQGWGLTATAATAIDKATYKPNGNIDVYVIWIDATTAIAINFYLDYPIGQQNPHHTLHIPENTAMGARFPARPSRTGFAFAGWYNAAEFAGTLGARKYESDTIIDAPINLFAKWVADTISAANITAADELLYLQNGGYAFYEFDLGTASLADYGTITVDYLISDAGLQVWNDNGLRGIRLYGVFESTFADINTDVDAAQYGFANVQYININTTAYNAPYILDQGNTGDSMKSSVTGDDWFTVTYELSGDRKNGSYEAAHLPAAQTGKVYFALGLSCQNTSKGNNRDVAFLQLVKNVKLVPKTTATPVSGVKPTGWAQFLCYDDPIVFEWRAEATQANYDNWRTLIPALPADLFDRGDPPDDLVEVVLYEGVANGTGAFSYINSGNTDFQKGWVSFGEAGKANDQSVTTDSTITFNNFKNAWYLVLETAEKPSGTVTLVWMGDAGNWEENAATTTSGGAESGKSEIEENDDGTYTIKFFLPGALSPYGKYFNDNKGWAGIALSYWGDNTVTPRPSVTTLGITKAYLLVSAEEVEPNVTSGVALGLSFTLGTAPAGGALIDDVELNAAGTSLTVSAVNGITGYRWYVDGALQATETSSALTITVATGNVKTITLQAQRGGKWVSQAVIVAVN